MTALFLFGAIRVVAVYCAARYLVDFSLSQAVFIAFLAAVLETRYLKNRASGLFQPFSLYIDPNYPLILKDAGLIEAEHELGDLLRAGDASVKGTECVVLDFKAESTTHLIAWPEWKDYTARLEHGIAEIRVDELKAPLAWRYEARCRKGNGLMKARFGVRPCRIGFEIFMRIDDEWWRNRWAGSVHSKPQFGESTHYDAGGPGDIDLAVAIIPYAELQHFYRWHPNRLGISSKRRHHALKVLGWKDDTDPGFHLLSGGYFFLSHQYLSVTHCAIDQVV